MAEKKKKKKEFLELNKNENVTYQLLKKRMYRTVFWTLWERERMGWLGRRHWNTYNIIYGTSRQSRFDARYWMPGAGAPGWPRGMVWGVRREEGSGWGTHVYLWQIHFDIWQNHYNIVKFKNKITLKKREWRKIWKRPNKIFSTSLFFSVFFYFFLNTTHYKGKTIMCIIWGYCKYKN